MARLSAVAVVAAISMAVALAACGGGTRTVGTAAGASASAGRSEVVSNVLFTDYAGTKACEPCHAERVASWLRSPMHNMTRDAATAVVRAPFDGRTFAFKGDTAKLETVGDARYVTLSSSKFGSARYRVAHVIGGHYREDYTGIADGASEELVLPLSFVFATQSFRYKGYSVMVKERGGLRAGPVWNQTCIFCHNTPPYLSTVLGALAGPSARPYQGEVVDPLLPRDRRASYEITDADGLSRAVSAELARLGAKRAHPTAEDGVTVTRNAFRKEHLVEVGIGCEACHLGSAEHVRDPKTLPTFEPKSSFFAVRLPGKASRAARINRICARCHQVLFSGYEPTWEGGARHGVAGGGHINSGEARDMLLGACASKLSCVECHEPHAADATAGLRRLDVVQKDALCTRCHDRYASRDALRAHSHHDPAGEGARCLSCHMPKKNLALDGGTTRYHRIGSPTDPPRVLLDRPVECATCHGERTVESLVGTMETWWKRAYDREALRKLYGDLSQPVAMATAERGKPHEQAVAFYVLGEARSKSAIPTLARQLTHPYPLVRGYAKRALDAIAGAPIPVDIDADEAEIEAQIRAWLHPPER